MNFRKPLFIVKLLNWEYWPFEVVYFPVFFYYLWLAFRARSLFYFSASNPSIVTGGMKGESKGKILSLIPPEFVARTITVHYKTSFEEVLRLLKEYDFHYPVISKPDVGERGRKVEKIKNESQLAHYWKEQKESFLIQEYADYPVELGIFYYRLPEAETGKVTSITKKHFLQVKGDGKSTVAQLMLKNPRARFQMKRLLPKLGLELTFIPELNKNVLLEPIGNHCRGTTFLNANHFITRELEETIDRISKSIPGFYYGRYDLRCKSIEDLKKGKHIKILELNGAGAEPSHIYHPGASVIEAYRVLFHHWNVMYRISIANNKKGVPYLSFKEGIQAFKIIQSSENVN